MITQTETSSKNYLVDYFKFISWDNTILKSIFCGFKIMRHFFKSENFEKYGILFVTQMYFSVDLSKVVITRSRLAGMQFCRVLTGSWPCYTLFKNYILWLCVKNFISAKWDPTFVLQNAFLPEKKFNHRVIIG